MNERIDDGGLFEGQPLCLVILNHPSLVASRTPSLTLPVPPSSVPGPGQSIILSTVSSSLHPLNPIRSGKQLFFSCAIHSTQLAPIPPFPPLYWFPLMHHGKGVSHMYLVFCFVYILFDVLTFFVFNLIDSDGQKIMK